MTKISDYINKGAKKFTDLEDAPSSLIPNKYLKVSEDGLWINQENIDATSVSGLENSNLGFPYKFDTSTSGTISSGYIGLDGDPYSTSSIVRVHGTNSRNNDMSTWIESWDDSSNTIKGVLNISSKTNTSKFAMFKVTGTPAGTFGTGSDGDVVISGTVNINTDIIAVGRSYADGIAYKLSSVGGSAVVVSETPNGIVSGDQVLLINTRGNGTSNYDNTGKWEVKTVESVMSTTITFTESITNYYGDNNSNSNISDHKVIIQRIPNYSSITIASGATLTANSFDTTTGTGGIVAFKCSDTCTVLGDIITSELGYEGGNKNYNSAWYLSTGGSYPRGVVWTRNNVVGQIANYGGGAAGSGQPGGNAMGAGGGYGIAGDNGGVTGTAVASIGGSVYGEQTLLEKMFHGSGGGHGREDENNLGGTGGGIILIYANTCDLYGNILSKGRNAPYNWLQTSGAGAGGSILIQTSILNTNSSTINATGGTGAVAGNGGKSGDGGDGRIAIYYSSIGNVISTTPDAYTDILETGNESYEFLVNWLSNNGTFNIDEDVLVAYNFNY